MQAERFFAQPGRTVGETAGVHEDQIDETPTIPRPAIEYGPRGTLVLPHGETPDESGVFARQEAGLVYKRPGEAPKAYEGPTIPMESVILSPEVRQDIAAEEARQLESRRSLIAETLRLPENLPVSERIPKLEQLAQNLQANIIDLENQVKDLSGQPNERGVVYQRRQNKKEDLARVMQMLDTARKEAKQTAIQTLENQISLISNQVMREDEENRRRGMTNEQIRNNPEHLQVMGLLMEKKNELSRLKQPQAGEKPKSVQKSTVGARVRNFFSGLFGRK